jgi:predicted MFS family arabinose efflux permease
MGRGGQLLLLAAAMAAGGYVRTAVSPLQEAMRLALSLSDNQMALLQGPVIGIPVALAAVPLGLLIDRYSRVVLLRVLVVLSLIGSLLTAFASSLTLMLLARCLTGLTGLGILPVVLSLLADLYAPTLRGRVTTIVVVGQVAGNSAAFALGGALLAMTGTVSEGWRWAMLWMTAPLALILLSMLALREPPRTGLSIKNPSARQVWAELRQYRAVIATLAIGIVLAETAVGAMLIWASPMLSRRFALAPDRIGDIMAMGMLVSGILGPVIGGTLADLCQRSGGPRRTVAVLSALAFVSVPAGLFAFAPGAGLTSVLLVAAMTIVLAVAVMGMTIFTIVIPNELRGLCMSVLVAAEVLFALAVAPVSVSLLSGALGGLAMIGKSLSIVCVTTSILAAATFAIGRRFFPRSI